MIRWFSGVVAKLVRIFDLLRRHGLGFLLLCFEVLLGLELLLGLMFLIDRGFMVRHRFRQMRYFFHFLVSLLFFLLNLLNFVMFHNYGFNRKSLILTVSMMRLC